MKVGVAQQQGTFPQNTPKSLTPLAKELYYNIYNKYADFREDKQGELPHELKRIDRVIGGNLRFKTNMKVFQWDSQALKQNISRKHITHMKRELK